MTTRLHDDDLEPLTPETYGQLVVDLDADELGHLLSDRERAMLAESAKAEDDFFAENDNALTPHDPYGKELDFEGWRGFHIFRAR
jgi:hypothetical protein